VESLKRAIELSPDNSTFWANLCMAHTILAGYNLEHGRDPQPSLVQATEAIRKAIDNNPKDATAQRYLGETNGTWARFRARQRQGKAEDFEQAAQAFEQAIDLAPEDQEYRVAFGHFCRDRAAFQRDPGNPPGSSLARGLELVNQVLATRPTWPEAWILRASLRLLQAQSSGPAAQRREQAASAAADFSRALAIHPTLDKAWRSQAALAQQLAAGPR